MRATCSVQKRFFNRLNSGSPEPVTVMLKHPGSNLKATLTVLQVLSILTLLVIITLRKERRLKKFEGI